MISRLVTVGAALLAVGVSAAAAGPNHAGRSMCTTRVVNGTFYYCGPATAKLSKFSGVTFRSGTCLKQPKLFFLALGTRTSNARTNNGKQYFGLSVAGPILHPVGGGVMGFVHGRKWSGSITSFHGNTRSGTFSARGVNGSSGTARGSYRC